MYEIIDSLNTNLYYFVMDLFDIAIASLKNEKNVYLNIIQKRLNKWVLKNPDTNFKNYDFNLHLYFLNKYNINHNSKNNFYNSLSNYVGIKLKNYSALGKLIILDKIVDFIKNHDEMLLYDNFKYGIYFDLPDELYKIYKFLPFRLPRKYKNIRNN